MTQPNLPIQALVIPLCFLVLLLFGARNSQAEQVNGSYSVSSDKTITVKLERSGRTPSSLIVLLRLPAGSSIAEIKPSAAKIDSQTGTIKWLVKLNNKNRATLRVTTVQPISADRIQGVLRYRQASSGSIRELPLVQAR